MICRQKTRASSIHRVEDAQRMQRKCLYCFGMLLHRSFVASDRYNTPPRVCGDDVLAQCQYIIRFENLIDVEVTTSPFE